MILKQKRARLGVRNLISSMNPLYLEIYHISSTNSECIIHYIISIHFFPSSLGCFQPAVAASLASNVRFLSDLLSFRRVSRRSYLLNQAGHWNKSLESQCFGELVMDSKQVKIPIIPIYPNVRGSDGIRSGEHNKSSK